LGRRAEQAGAGSTTEIRDAKLIKLYGDVRGKHGRYVPFWA
jgi:hypothetical protein